MFSEKLWTDFEMYLEKHVILLRNGKVKCELDPLGEGKKRSKEMKDGNTTKKFGLRPVEAMMLSRLLY